VLPSWSGSARDRARHARWVRWIAAIARETKIADGARSSALDRLRRHAGSQQKHASRLPTVREGVPRSGLRRHTDRTGKPTGCEGIHDVHTNFVPNARRARSDGRHHAGWLGAVVRHHAVDRCPDHISRQPSPSSVNGCNASRCKARHQYRAAVCGRYGCHEIRITTHDSVGFAANTDALLCIDPLRPMDLRGTAKPRGGTTEFRCQRVIRESCHHSTPMRDCMGCQQRGSPPARSGDRCLVPDP